MKAFLYSRKMIYKFTWLAFVYGPIATRKYPTRLSFAIATYKDQKQIWDRMYKTRYGKKPRLLNFL